MNGAVGQGGEKRRGTDSARFPPHRLAGTLLALAAVAALTPAAAQDALSPELAGYVAQHYEAVYRMQTAPVAAVERKRPQHLIIVKKDAGQKKADQYVLRQIAATQWTEFTVPGHARPQR